MFKILPVLGEVSESFPSKPLFSIFCELNSKLSREFLSPFGYLNLIYFIFSSHYPGKAQCFFGGSRLNGGYAPGPAFNVSNRLSGQIDRDFFVVLQPDPKLSGFSLKGFSLYIFNLFLCELSRVFGSSVYDKVQDKVCTDEFSLISIFDTDITFFYKPLDEFKKENAFLSCMSLFYEIPSDFFSKEALFLVSPILSSKLDSKDFLHSLVLSLEEIQFLNKVSFLVIFKQHYSEGSQGALRNLRKFADKCASGFQFFQLMEVFQLALFASKEFTLDLSKGVSGCSRYVRGFSEEYSRVFFETFDTFLNSFSNEYFFLNSYGPSKRPKLSVSSVFSSLLTFSLLEFQPFSRLSSYVSDSFSQFASYFQNYSQTKEGFILETLDLSFLCSSNFSKFPLKMLSFESRVDLEVSFYFVFLKNSFLRKDQLERVHSHFLSDFVLDKPLFLKVFLKKFSDYFETERNRNAHSVYALFFNSLESSQYEPFSYTVLPFFSFYNKGVLYPESQLKSLLSPFLAFVSDSFWTDLYRPNGDLYFPFQFFSVAILDSKREPLLESFLMGVFSSLAYDSRFFYSFDFSFLRNLSLPISLGTETEISSFSFLQDLQKVLSLSSSFSHASFKDSFFELFPLSNLSFVNTFFAKYPEKFLSMGLPVLFCPETSSDVFESYFLFFSYFLSKGFEERALSLFRSFLPLFLNLDSTLTADRLNRLIFVFSDVLFSFVESSSFLSLSFPESILSEVSLEYSKCLLILLDSFLATPFPNSKALRKKVFICKVSLFNFLYQLSLKPEFLHLFSTFDFNLHRFELLQNFSFTLKSSQTPSEFVSMFLGEGYAGSNFSSMSLSFLLFLPIFESNDFSFVERYPSEFLSFSQKFFEVSPFNFKVGFFLYVKLMDQSSRFPYLYSLLSPLFESYFKQLSCVYSESFLQGIYSSLVDEEKKKWCFLFLLNHLNSCRSVFYQSFEKYPFVSEFFRSFLSLRVSFLSQTPLSYFEPELFRNYLNVSLEDLEGLSDKPFLFFLYSIFMDFLASKNKSCHFAYLDLLKEDSKLLVSRFLSALSSMSPFVFSFSRSLTYKSYKNYFESLPHPFAKFSAFLGELVVYWTPFMDGNILDTVLPFFNSKTSVNTHLLHQFLLACVGEVALSTALPVPEDHVLTFGIGSQLDSISSISSFVSILKFLFENDLVLFSVYSKSFFDYMQLSSNCSFVPVKFDFLPDHSLQRDTLRALITSLMELYALPVFTSLSPVFYETSSVYQTRFLALGLFASLEKNTESGTYFAMDTLSLFDYDPLSFPDRLSVAVPLLLGLSIHLLLKRYFKTFMPAPFSFPMGLLGLSGSSSYGFSVPFSFVPSSSLEGFSLFLDSFFSFFPHLLRSSLLLSEGYDLFSFPVESLPISSLKYDTCSFTGILEDCEFKDIDLEIGSLNLFLPQKFQFKDKVLPFSGRIQGTFSYFNKEKKRTTKPFSSYITFSLGEEVSHKRILRSASGVFQLTDTLRASLNQVSFSVSGKPEPLLSSPPFSRPVTLLSKVYSWYDSFFNDILRHVDKPSLYVRYFSSFLNFFTSSTSSVSFSTKSITDLSCKPMHFLFRVFGNQLLISQLDLFLTLLPSSTSSTSSSKFSYSFLQDRKNLALIKSFLEFLTPILSLWLPSSIEDLKYFRDEDIRLLSFLSHLFRVYCTTLSHLDPSFTVTSSDGTLKGAQSIFTEFVVTHFERLQILFRVVYSKPPSQKFFLYSQKFWDLHLSHFLFRLNDSLKYTFFYQKQKSLGVTPLELTLSSVSLYSAFKSAPKLDKHDSK